jgi:hypothetical protein
VVKNVSGYDIHKLMIGALGTLGIITRINFRTFPLPSMTRTYVATFRAPAAACEFRHAIARSVLRPQSVEILAAREDSGLRLEKRAGLSFDNDRWPVVVSFSGNEQVLDRNRHELEALARRAEPNALESFTELHSDEQNMVTGYITDFPAVITEHSPAAAIFKISALPTELPALADSFRSCQLPWAAMMRGLGVTYLAVLPPRPHRGVAPALEAGMRANLQPTRKRAARAQRAALVPAGIEAGHQRLGRSPRRFPADAEAEKRLRPERHSESRTIYGRALKPWRPHSQSVVSRAQTSPNTRITRAAYIADSA